MSPSDQTPNPRTLGDRVLGGAGGVFLLLIAAAMTYAFFFAPPEDPGEFGLGWHCILLLVFLWGLTVAFFTGCFKSRRVERMGDWLFLAACLAFAGFLVGAILHDNPPDSMGQRGMSTRDATLIVLIVLVVPLGFIIISGVMLTSPLVGLILFGPLVLLTYLGARIGAIWGHPLLGAMCGPVVWVGLFALLILVGSKLWRGEKPVPQPGSAAEPGNGEHPSDLPDA